MSGGFNGNGKAVETFWKDQAVDPVIVTKENFGEFQSFISTRAAAIRAESNKSGFRLDKDAVSLAYTELAARLGIGEKSLRSQMGKMRNQVGRDRRRNVPKNPAGIQAAADRLAGKNGGSPIVSAGIVPLVSSRVIDPAAEKREMIRKYLAAELKRLSLKSGQKVVLTWIDQATAEIARGLLRSVLSGFGWNSFRSQVDGVDLIIERR